MERSTPMSFTNSMIGKAVVVMLKNGTAYRGRLKAFDVYTNIVLENCEEIGQVKRRKSNEVFIQGRNLQCCGLDEGNK